MKVSVSTLLFTLTALFSFGQQCFECKENFDRLIEIEEEQKISTSALKESWALTKNLYEKGYIDYNDSISKNTIYVSQSLTHAFSNIIRKRCDSLSISYYLMYLDMTTGSAEEERSFGLERIFKRCPETVLDQIDPAYFDELAWGFINNRFYGSKSPLDKEDYIAMTINNNPPKPVLNKENYALIFNETYPTLTSNKKFSEEIKLLLKKIKENLQG